jgi:malate dehydrogenase (quinone)
LVRFGAIFLALPVMATSNPDIVLIGAGIMSATLGVMLKHILPGLSIHVYERLDEIAEESSDPWNNAGTGHSAFCELNYTPERKDGHIDISKAIKIAGQFETSKEFWAFAVRQGWVVKPTSFIVPVPHMSFVWGNENVDYLKRRHEALIAHPLFKGMEYSADPARLKEWMPLVMEGRDLNEPVAATRMELGTDVNFGCLTRMLFAHLERLPGVELFTGHEIRDIDREERDEADKERIDLSAPQRANKARWRLRVKDRKTGKKHHISARFVFIGAGGGALPLLEKADIPEADGYGGFPVSGQWLICQDQSLVSRHHAKVYGKASVGAPPMSVPHLDARMIEGRPAMLFGPYAGFSTRFLKHGSLMDLPLSLTWSNIRPMISAGLHNIPLTRYLIDQVRQSDEDRMQALRHFMPTAKAEDWKLATAGQRVQVIKKDKEGKGILEFGTELVASADGSLAALLGASPGASTSVSIMLELMERCFGTQQWEAKIMEMIPTYCCTLKADAELIRKTRIMTSEVLGLPVMA